MALMHEDFFTLGGIFTLAGFVVEEFYCIWDLLLCFTYSVLCCFFQKRLYTFGSSSFECCLTGANRASFPGLETDGSLNLERQEKLPTFGADTRRSQIWIMTRCLGVSDTIMILASCKSQMGRCIHTDLKTLLLSWDTHQIHCLLIINWHPGLPTNNNCEMTEFLYANIVLLHTVYSKLLNFANIKKTGHVTSVESVAQVVGRRTRDQKVPGSNPETGLNYKVAAKLWNRVPHEPPMTQS